MSLKDTVTSRNMFVTNEKQENYFFFQKKKSFIFYSI